MANITVNDVITLITNEYNSQYIAKKTNAQLDDPLANPQTEVGLYKYKYTKYARDLHAGGYYNGDKNGFDWCTIFVDWSFYHLCGDNKEAAELIKPQASYGNGAVVKYAKGAFVNIGRCDNTPRVGDQAFIRDKDGGVLSHTGIVIEVGSNYVTTIDGNISRTINGIKYPSTVSKWRRSMGWYDSFGHPNYTDSTLYTISTNNQISNCTVNVPENGNGGSSILIELIPNFGYKFYTAPSISINGNVVTPTAVTGGKYRATFTLDRDTTIIATGVAQISNEEIQIAFSDTLPTSEDYWVPVKQYLSKVPLNAGPGEIPIKIWVRRKTPSESSYTNDPDPYLITQKIYRI